MNMKNLYKTIIAAGLLGLLGACAYDPAVDGYYSTSNSYYGQGYGQSSNNGNPGGYGYSSNGYSGNQQQPYCPDDDDD
jgi:hypothetical protein